MYGAAAIILERYADELLFQCESIMNHSKMHKEKKRLVELFKLKSRINRSPTIQKSYMEIKNDADRWRKISDIAKHI